MTRRHVERPRTPLQHADAEVCEPCGCYLEVETNGQGAIGVAVCVNPRCPDKLAQVRAQYATTGWVH